VACETALTSLKKGLLSLDEPNVKGSIGIGNHNSVRLVALDFLRREQGALANFWRVNQTSNKRSRWNPAFIGCL
jgi:hypothetical protein